MGGAAGVRGPKDNGLAPNISNNTILELTSEYLRKEFINSITDSSLNRVKANLFLRDDLIYGKGIKNINLGLIKPIDYTDTTPARVVQSPNYPQASEQILTDEFKVQAQLTVSQVENLKAFSSAEEFSRFVATLKNSGYRSMKNFNQQLVEYIFGWNNADVLSLTPGTIEQLDKIKLKLMQNKVVDATVNTTLDLVKLINKTSMEMEIIDKNNSSNKKVAAAVGKSDQILVMSRKDALALKFETSTIYNQEAYKLDGFYSILYLDIPEGTFFILDKEALRIYPRITDTTSQTFGSRNEVDYYFWYFATVGVIEDLAIKYFTK